jgi:hypothetical protein
LPYICGIIALTPSCPASLLHKARYQVGQLQQIGKAKQPASVADDDIRIGGNDIRPVPGHRANTIFAHAEQQPRPVPGVPLAGAGELQTGQRVERVGHAYKTRTRLRRACSSW